MKPADAAKKEPGRRQLLGVLATGAGVAAAGAATWPLAAGLVEPLGDSPRPPQAPWVDVADEKEVGEMPLRAAVRVPVRDGFFTILQERGAVWLRRSGRGEITALSATCPHLGCGIGLDGKGAFACPCHASKFTLDGAWVHGPSPRAMDPLPLRIENGRVVVQAVGFAAGTKERKTL